jgi:hypothetical protein
MTWSRSSIRLLRILTLSWIPYGIWRSYGAENKYSKEQHHPNSLHHRGIGFCTTADPVRDSRVSLQISCFTFIGQEADESPNPAYH